MDVWKPGGGGGGMNWEIEIDIYTVQCVTQVTNEYLGFPGGSVVKKWLASNAGGVGSIPGLGRSPLEGNSNPLQYFCMGNPMNRSLVGCSPWSHRQAQPSD